MPTNVVPVKDDEQALEIARVTALKSGKTAFEGELLLTLWRIADALENR
jgi:hypothetical protein